MSTDALVTWAFFTFFTPILIAIALGFVWFYIYVQDVLPTLIKHGEPAVWALRKGELDLQIAAYGRLCEKEGRRLTRYRYLVISQKAMVGSGVVALSAWVVVFWAQMRGR